MQVNTVTISKTDTEEISNMGINMLDTTQEAAHVNTSINYEDLTQAEKDIADAFFAMALSKV